ncbi:hypothetical protein QSH39_021015 [Xanthomonas arboricola pv. corylina]|uniref:hypothetical protein n=1 Tax=Xanthomonas arboricola TaxID=56448 RepID=UPI0025B0D307|nr:hypothetical protein [Xanthomonas arboricola]MDN0205321.1 hypothetical protein [Xanthomonas arboricola pv. corylina]MDN0215395.1 hypothetical protein [Xanthomonas arboricola pv. corylina]
MTERSIDGFQVWTGAEKMGLLAQWTGTIGVKGADGEAAVHSLDGQCFSQPQQAHAYAEERLRAVIGIGPDLDLIF